MKHKKMSIIISLILVILNILFFHLFAGQSGEKSPPLMINPVLSESEIFITLDIGEYSHENELIRATVHNNTDFEISTEQGIAIEYFNGRFWENVPNIGLAFADVGGHILPNDIKIIDIDLQWFTQIHQGLFRIRYRVGYGGFDVTPNHDLVAEFYLK